MPVRTRILSLILFLFVTIEAGEKNASPFHFYWPAESALLGVGISGGLLGKERLGSMLPADSNDLHREDLAIWDRFAAGGYNHTADVTSDYLVYSVGGSMLFADIWMAGKSGETWRPVLEDLLLLGEAFTWSAALNLNVRALRVHPRPLTYAGSGAPVSERTVPEAAGSFYSGHASAAFLGAAYLATVYPLRHPEFHQRGLLWGGALAAAATVAGLRVAAGKHFPSDVVVGAAVGTLLGWGIPRLHWRAPKTGMSGSLGLYPLSGGIGLRIAMAIPGGI